MMNNMTLLIVLIVVGSLLILSLLVFGIWYLLSLRNYIYIVKDGKAINVKRQFKWVSGDKLTFQGKDYLCTEDCVGNVNGRKGVYLTIGKPSCFKFPIYDGKVMKWEYLSQGTINAIINDEHVKTIAQAGQTGIGVTDIIVLIVVCLTLLLVFLLIGKAFGAFKAAPVECIYNMTKFVK
jgi:hypothetical protein